MSLAAVQQRVTELQTQLAPPSLRPAGGVAGTQFKSLLDRLGLTPTDGMAGDSASADGESIVADAKQYLGVPYVWGGTSPNGFDCSGLVQHVFKQHGISLPRHSSDQARAGHPVALDDLRPGDLVFFGRPVDHVGIYAGNGKMVVAPHTGAVVRVQDVNMSVVTAARRVLPDNASFSSALPRSTGDWVANLPAAGRPYAGAIEQAARANGLDPRLVAAVAWSESGFRPDAQSGAGAVGLMQLMPGTAAGLGVDPRDPTQALMGGAKYLAGQLQRFGRVDLALAAYNAGPSAVMKAGGVPPYAETQGYVARVIDRMGQL